MDLIGIFVALLTTSATLLVTVILFMIEWARHRREGRFEARRQLISRVLDVVDSVMRRRGFPLHPSAGGELDYALIVPRLFLELHPRERPIAAWTSRQVQLMLLAPSDKAAMKIGYRIGVELLKWHHGEREIDWFRDQVRADPPVSDFRVPTPVKWRRTVSRSFGSFKLGLVGGVTLLTLAPTARELIRSLR